MEWALASIVAGDGAAAEGLPTPVEVAYDPTVCQNQTYLGHLYGRPTCQSEKAVLDLPAASPSKARHISAATPWSWGVSSLPPPGVTLPSLLERLPERPMASALIEELKIVATEAKRTQIEDAVGSSWAALAAEEDPQGRGIGTLLVKREQEEGGAWGRGCWTARTMGESVGNPA